VQISGSLIVFPGIERHGWVKQSNILYFLAQIYFFALYGSKKRLKKITSPIASKRIWKYVFYHYFSALIGPLTIYKS